MAHNSPVVHSYFVLSNTTGAVTMAFPHNTTPPPTLQPFLFPLAPTFLTTTFLVINSSPLLYCYVTQTPTTTTLVVSSYLHWAFFKSVLLHLTTLPRPQQVLFLASLHNLYPLPTLTTISYPMYNFSASFPPTHPTSENLQVLLRLDSTPLTLLLAALYNERRIVIQASNHQLLSVFIVSLLEILAPFSWQHSVVPLLPLKHLDLLQNPAPFIIGVDPSALDTVEFSDVVVLVDLETSSVRSNDPSVIRADIDILPKRWLSSLFTDLGKASLSNSPNLQSSIVKAAFRDFSENFFKLIRDAVRVAVESGEVLDLKVFRKSFGFLGEERRFIDVISRTAAFDQYVLGVEREIKAEGYHPKRKKSLLTWFSKEQLINLDDAKVSSSSPSEPFTL